MLYYSIRIPFVTSVIALLGIGFLFCVCGTNALAEFSVGELREIDRLPPNSTTRKGMVQKVRESAGDAFMQSAVDEFIAGRIAHETMFELLESLGHLLSGKSIRAVINASWQSAVESGNYRRFYQMVESYGQESDLERVFEALQEDFNAHGLDAVWALGTGEEVERAAEISERLITQGLVDEGVFDAFRTRITEQEEEGSSRLVRRQRQALLEMTAGERNLYFAFRRSLELGQAWEPLLDVLREEGGETAWKLLSRDVVPDYLEESFADVMEKVFTEDDLTGRFRDERLGATSLSAIAKQLVGHVPTKQQLEEKASDPETGIAEDPETQSRLWLSGVIALVIIAAAISLLWACKGNPDR